MGTQVNIISTRLPATQLMSHTWTAEAQERTTYLTPLKHWGGTLKTLWQGGWTCWSACFKKIWQAEVPSRSSKLRLLGLMIVGAEVAYLARRGQWQHLHVHSCADSANIALFANLISGLPYSLTLHGPLGDYGPNQAQKWSNAKMGIVITQTLFEEVNQALAGYLPPQVAIAPMGVNTGVFQRTIAYQPWEQGPIRLFSCGRLNPCKGHADLIEAIVLLHQQGIAATLEIAGEDEQGGTGYRQTLEALIQRLNLTDSVQLLGAVSEHQIKASLESAHVFVLASLHEPLGVAIMEAMAMEVPVVVTGAGGVKELITSGIEGLLVEPESPHQLAEAIAQVLNNPHLAQSLGAAARSRIIEQFHSRRSAETLLSLIS
jgi:colanic acid/amylovoran biosynthesis glycosyltransferase